MSKKLYSMLCAATLLSLTACTADDPFATGSGDGNVIFTVQAPGQLGSRAEGAAFGDGTTATRLDYYLYQINENGPEYVGADHTDIKLTAKVPLKLVTGRTYGIVWLAQAYAGETPTYDYNTDSHTITVSYDDLDQNLENRDAFYEYTEFKVEGAGQKTVELKRPFAQINFGTSDMKPEGLDYKVLEQAFGKDLEGLKTSLKVTASLPTTLNLLTKEVGESEDVEFTFNATGVPANQEFPYQPKNAQGEPIPTYEYLAMDYILCGDNGVVDLDFSVLNGETPYNTIKVSSAPVKANYRTNIFGQLLTSTVDFDVEIQPMLNDFTDWEVVANGVIYDAMSKCYIIQNAEGLKWFNNEANVKKNNFDGKTIKLGADIDMDGIEWRGLYDFDYVYSKWFRGTFDGDGHTIANLTATGSKEAGFFAHMEYGVVKNLNLKNVNVSGNYSVGGIAGIAYTSKIENCTVDGGTIVTTPKWFEAKNEYNEGNNAGGIVGLMVAQPQSEAEKAESSTGVIDCKVSNVEVRAYRKVGAVAGSFSKNKSAYAGDPVVKGNSATDCSVMAIMDVTPYNGAHRKDEANELFGSFNNYDDIVPAESANTATNVTVNVIKGEVIENGIVKEENKDNSYLVSSAEGLVNLAELINKQTRATAYDYAHGTYTLLSDVDLAGIDWTPIGNSYEKPFSGTIDGNGHTIKNLNIKGNEKVAFVSDLRGTVKNLIFDGVKVVGHHYLGVVGGYTTDHCSAYVENVTVRNAEVICTPDNLSGKWDNGDKNGIIYGYMANGNYGIKNCTVENSTLSGYRDMGAIAGVCQNTVDGCTVKNVTINQINFSVLNDPKTEANANCQAIVGRTADLSGSNVTENNTVINFKVNYGAAE